MGVLEPKKMALLRILQILEEDTDVDHHLTQEQIATKLERDHGIEMERKAIGRNLALLDEAGYEIASERDGNWLVSRKFEDSELHLLIDSVLASRHIPEKASRDLIKKLCELSSRYFESSVKHIHSISDWDKNDNQDLFWNIEQVEEAIKKKRKVVFEYNKYGRDKKLAKTSTQKLSPYLMLLHNQHYYLMGYNDHWKNMSFLKLDRIRNIEITDEKAVPVKEVPGYENGINYKTLTTERPYLFGDKPEHIVLLVEDSAIDQVIEWFGKDVEIEPTAEENKVKIRLKASPNAMEHWAKQFLDSVEVVSPGHLRTRIRESLSKGLEKYE